MRSRIPHVEEYYDRLQYEVDSLGGFRLAKNQKLPHITINSRGYRGKEWSGTEEVLLLGDSVAFGVGAESDADCFARFLETATGTTIADASVRAYRVTQHYAQLPNLLESLLRARRVVLWFGYADLLYWTTTGGCLDGAFQFERKYAPDARAFSNAGFPLNMVAPFAAALVGKLNATNERRECRKGSVSDLAHYVTTFVRAIHDICRARNIETRVLIQPFIRQSPANADLKRIADFYSDRTQAKCKSSWYQVADDYVTTLVAQLEKHGIPTVDLQPHVSEDGYLDQVHIKQDALRALAAIAAKALSR